MIDDSPTDDSGIRGGGIMLSTDLLDAIAYFETWATSQTHPNLVKNWTGSIFHPIFFD